MIQGIDVSHYQGNIDWGKVAKAGIKFAYVKASQGATIQDAKADDYVDGAKAAGLLVGLYHYFTPTGDAGAQYRNFMSVAEKCGGLQGMLVPALDVEGDVHNGLGDMSGADYASSALAWLSYIGKSVTKKCIVYTFPSFSAKLQYKLGGSPLWCASYPSLSFTNGAMNGFPGWDNWTIWQYSDKGSIKGISGYVDLDAFNGGSDDLKRLVI